MLFLSSSITLGSRAKMQCGQKAAGCMHCLLRMKADVVNTLVKSLSRMLLVLVL